MKKCFQSKSAPSLDWNHVLQIFSFFLQLKIIFSFLFRSKNKKKKEVRTILYKDNTSWMKRNTATGVKRHSLSCLICRFVISLLPYHWTKEISSRKLFNRAFHPVLAEDLHYRTRALWMENQGWRKRPSKTDLLLCRKQIIPKPGVHRSNKNSELQWSQDVERGWVVTEFSSRNR